MQTVDDNRTALEVLEALAADFLAGRVRSADMSVAEREAVHLVVLRLALEEQARIAAGRDAEAIALARRDAWRLQNWVRDAKAADARSAAA